MILTKTRTQHQTALVSAAMTKGTQVKTTTAAAAAAASTTPTLTPRKTTKIIEAAAATTKQQQKRTGHLKPHPAPAMFSRPFWVPVYM